MSPDREQALIERAKTEPDAFAELYHCYVDRIYAFVYRRVENTMLAQDITSVTFEKALRALPTYRAQGAGFCAWLYTIARNEVVGHQRRRRVTALLHADQPGPLKLDWLVERNEELDTLRTAFGRLSNNDQEVLTLRFFEELSSAEVGEVLGCKTSAVYVRLHRALKRLAAQFEAEETVAVSGHRASGMQATEQ
jgi:RNA polymerase sigma-70 factor (ECF subfamily)